MENNNRLRINYSKYVLNLELGTSTIFKNLPTIVFRGAIGRELRRMSCIFPNRICQQCSINKTCVYSFLFETHIDKNNDFIYGRDRASHPFIINIEAETHKPLNFVELELTLIGKATDYLPYFYQAVTRAGELGFSKDSIKYKIADVINKGKSVLSSVGGFNIPKQLDVWELDSEANKTQRADCLIEFKTPLRIKKDGKYLRTPTYSDIINSIQRRVLVLSSLYQDSVTNNKLDRETVEVWSKNKIMETQARWVDVNYYSRSQNESLKLGGVVGKISIDGEFSPQEFSLLRAGELFNIGKNVAFGLGKIKIMEGRI